MFQSWVVVFLMGVFGVSWVSANAAGRDSSPNEIVVQYKPVFGALGTVKMSVRAALGSNSILSVRTLAGAPDFEVIRLRKGLSIQRSIERLVSNPAVQYYINKLFHKAAPCK